MHKKQNNYILYIRDKKDIVQKQSPEGVLFLNKVQHVFSCEFCEISKNTLFLHNTSTSVNLRNIETSLLLMKTLK